MLRILVSLMIITCAFGSLPAQVDNPCSPDSVVSIVSDSVAAMPLKSLHTYNDRKQLQGTFSYYFYQPGPQQPKKWIPYTRRLNTYNNDGTHAGFTEHIWSDTGWNFRFAMEYTYDPYGRRISETRIIQDLDGKPVKNFMETISYNSWGKEAARTWNQWELPGQWHHQANVVHSYDNEKRLTRTKVIYWFDSDSTWREKQKDSFTYVHGLLAEKIYSSHVANQWLKLERDTFGYDMKGRKTMKIYQEWGNYRWWNRNMETYAYNRNGCAGQIGYAFAPSASPDSWSYATKDTFYYPRLSKHLAFYPNPATKRLYVDVPHELTFSIVENTGRKILEQKVFKGENEIDISMIARGWYIVYSVGYSGILVIE
jgi:hypothetical protein